MTTIDLQTAVDVRTAHRSEYGSAAEVAVAAFARLGAHLVPTERKTLYGNVRATTTNPDPGKVIVAVAAGRVVGSVVYNGPGEGQHPKFSSEWAFFRALGVDEAWMGRGIGRRLVEACIAHASIDRAAWIGLYAADPNKAAVSLYGRMGFKVIGDAFPHFGVTYRVYGLDLSETNDGSD